MTPSWTSGQLAGLFIAVLLAAGGGTLVLVWRFRRGGAPRRHVVTPAWTPVARELVARGVASPELLVFTLANYELRLASGEVVAGKLPRGVATVADLLGETLPAVQRATVARAATPEGASALLADLRALRPRLDALPAVAEVGALWPEDPADLVAAVRHYAKICAVPLP